MMDIRPQVLALKTLAEKIDLSQHVDALFRYSAARVIVDRLRETIEETQKADEQEGVDYMFGKIMGFIWKLEQAVMPVPDSYNSPLSWWKEAMQDLLVVEIKLQGD